MSLVRCKHCTRSLTARFATDGHGHVIEEVAFCGCAGSRKAAGICAMCDQPLRWKSATYCGKVCRDEALRRKRGYKGRKVRLGSEGESKDRRLSGMCQHCDLPVNGKPKVALYCATHKKAAGLEAGRKHRAKVGPKHSRAYYYRHIEKRRADAIAYYRDSPERRARRNQTNKEWRARNPDKVAAFKRRDALKGNVARRSREHRARMRAA